MADFLTLLKFLPTMIQMAKKFGELISSGVTEAQILGAFRAIDKAFVIADPRERAKRLNDVFRQK